MKEIGYDLSNRTPRAIPSDELAACDIVVTMGCSTLDLDTDTELRDWALEDPDGTDLEGTHRIRKAVRGNVEQLFDEVEAALES